MAMVTVRAIAERATHFGYLRPGDVVDMPPAYAKRYAEAGVVTIVAQPAAGNAAGGTRRTGGSGKGGTRRAPQADGKAGQ